MTPKWFGEETFSTLNNNLSSIFGFQRSTGRFLEFRSSGSYAVVNIYSGFRRFYHDFGIMGVIILPFIQGVISSYIYSAIKRKKEGRLIDFTTVFYSYFFYTNIYLIIDDLFYSSNVSISGLLKIIVLYLCYRIMMNGAKTSSTISTISD